MLNLSENKAFKFTCTPLSLQKYPTLWMRQLFQLLKKPTGVCRMAVYMNRQKHVRITHLTSQTPIRRRLHLHNSLNVPLN